MERAAKAGILLAKSEEKDYEAKTDGLVGEELGIKREIMFCEAILGEREKFIEQLKRENKRLMKAFVKVETKHDAIRDTNEKLKEHCTEVGAIFERRRSLNMSMSIKIDEAEAAYDKAKSENEDHHVRATKQMEQYSLMSQCRLESQNALTKILEIVQADSDNPELKTQVMKLNLKISRESYNKLKEIQKLQEERKIALKKGENCDAVGMGAGYY